MTAPTFSAWKESREGRDAFAGHCVRGDHLDVIAEAAFKAGRNSTPCGGTRLMPSGDPEFPVRACDCISLEKLLDTFSWAASAENDDEERKARAAIASFVFGRQAAIPDGWKLVPVEPTHDMLYAIGNLRKFGQWAWQNQQAWAAMLEAAPMPPVAP